MIKTCSKDKILLITGGTGSFGNAVMKRFLDLRYKRNTYLSRDEKTRRYAEEIQQ
ncbi:polysaccharide biosynthesis protein [Enterococcus faecalis]|nr:polysaccharide biosynthesis protein [Enterococcus faecalis]